MPKKAGAKLASSLKAVSIDEGKSSKKNGKHKQDSFPGQNGPGHQKKGGATAPQPIRPNSSSVSRDSGTALGRSFEGSKPGLTFKPGSLPSSQPRLLTSASASASSTAHPRDNHDHRRTAFPDAATSPSHAAAGQASSRNAANEFYYGVDLPVGDAGEPLDLLSLPDHIVEQIASHLTGPGKKAARLACTALRSAVDAAVSSLLLTPTNIRWLLPSHVAPAPGGGGSGGDAASGVSISQVVRQIPLHVRFPHLQLLVVDIPGR